MTKPKNLPDLTSEMLREIVSYDPENGVFRWKIQVGSRKPGDEAGYIRPDGYSRITVLGNPQLSHRLAWLYTHGCWPSDQLDHINGVRSDNRIANLREATHAQNHQNRIIRSDNKSGYLGVCWHKRDRKWVAQIRVNKKNIHLGVYDSPSDAAEAYLRAKQKLHTFNPAPR